MKTFSGANQTQPLFDFRSCTAMLNPGVYLLCHCANAPVWLLAPRQPDPTETADFSVSRELGLGASFASAILASRLMQPDVVSRPGQPKNRQPISPSGPAALPPVDSTLIADGGRGFPLLHSTTQVQIIHGGARA